MLLSLLRRPCAAHRMILLAVLWLSVGPFTEVCFGFTPMLPAYQFSSAAIGANPQTAIIQVIISGSGSLNAINVLTEGASSLDFSLSAGGTCSTTVSYATGQSCSVAVTFQPKFPGLRVGSIVLASSNGGVLGAASIRGIGLGSRAAIHPVRINLVAGTGQYIYNGDYGPAVHENLYLPMGGAVDGAGNVFISDSGNQRIRRVDAITGAMTTVAGNGVPGFGGDGGQAVSATLCTPSDVKLDGAGNLFIADTENHVIRRVDSTTGLITTIAGIGGQPGYSGDGGSATLAHLSSPRGIAFDGDHTLYIADTGNNVIRKVDLSTGIISTIAGNQTAGYGGDGGPAQAALLNSPMEVGVGPDGSIYIADSLNNRIRKVDPTDSISTIAGTGQNGYGGNEVPATTAILNTPAGLSVDPAGDVVIADSGNNLIRIVSSSTGNISLVSGDNTDDQEENQRTYDGPQSIWQDDEGNLYLSDTFHQIVSRISSNGLTIILPPMREGTASVPYPLIVLNEGNAPLDIAPITPGSYSQYDPATTTCPIAGPLDAGAQCIVGVQMVPTTLGNYLFGSLQIDSDATNSPITLTLMSDVMAGSSTTTSLSSSPNPSAAGSTVTFSASVANPSGQALTGSVTFRDGSSIIGTAPLTSGIAVLSISTLSLGTHSITAMYSGDSQDAPSTSPPVSQLVQTATSNLTLTSSANPAVFGSAVILRVAASSNGVTSPTGSIAFLDGSVSIGTSQLSSGIATYTVTSLGLGQHSITAIYAGDADNASSQSATLDQQIVQAPSLSLTASTNQTIVGVPVTFTTTFVEPQNFPATGTVTLTDNGIQLGTATIGSGGTATLILSNLAVGQHQVIAEYPGDANNLGARSSAVALTVAPISTTTSLLTSSNACPRGMPLTLTATVSGNRGDIPTGTVTFTDGSVPLGSASLNSSGVASLVLTGLAPGVHSILGTYSGDADNSPSSSPVLTQDITQPTTTALGSSGNPSLVLDSLVLTATVTNGSGQAPSGTVSYFDGTTLLGMSSLVGDTATLSLATLALGQHALSATYNGDSINLTRRSAALNQTIQLRPTTTSLTGSTTSSGTTQQLTLIAVVHYTGSTSPTGSVTFSANGSTIGTAAVDSNGVATLTISTTGSLAGATASYSGDGVYASSSSVSGTITSANSLQLTIQVNPQSITLQSKQQTIATVTLLSANSFADTINLGCAGLPFAATCTFSSDQVSLAAGATQTVQVTVDTAAPLASGGFAVNRAQTRSTVETCILPGAVFLGFTLIGWRRRGLKVVLPALTLCVLAVGICTLSGCAGLTTNGTRPGTYTFQITAIGAKTSVSQSTNVVMTVTQ